MLEYDEARNILWAYRSKAAIPPMPEHKVAEEYISVERYIHGADGKTPLIEEDIKNEFFPRLVQCLKVDESVGDLYIKDMRVVQGDAGYFNNRNWLVQVKFGSTRFYESKENPIGYLTIMEIPYVEQDGTLVYENKNYAFIRMLEQESTVSYEDKGATDKLLKVKLSRGTMAIAYNNNGPVIQMSDDKNKSGNKSYSLLQLMFAMAFRAGWSEEQVDSLWNEFRNSQVTNIPKNQIELADMKHCVIPNRGATDGIDYINKVAPKLMGEHILEKGTIYSVFESEEIRDEFNTMLSLDRAINDVLAKSVISVIHPGKKLYDAGTIVTQHMVDVCKSEGVYNLIVRNTESFEGFYLAQMVIVGTIPRGTKLDDTLRSVINEDGMYASRTYNLGVGAFGWDNSYRVTKDMITILKANGYEYIYVSEKPGQNYQTSQNGIKKFSFVNEVLSNRMFRSEDVGVQSESGWVYLNENNQFVEPTKFWTIWDMAALLSFTTRLFKGDYIDSITNADVGFRKRLVLPEQMYHRAFRNACIEGFAVMNRTLKEAWNSMPLNYGIPDNMDNKFYRFTKEFFKYMREKMKCLTIVGGETITNPVAYASAFTKVNVWVASKHSVMDVQRRIAIGSYGRMDAYEVPQSSKMGVVLNRSIGCETDLDGVTRVGYRRVRHNGNTSYVTDEIDYLTVREEEKFRIADICSMPADDTGKIEDNSSLVLCKVPSSDTVKKHTFSYLPISQIDYVNVHANQSLSWTSAAIPYLASNDAARAIFGCAQMKQAKGLVNAEWPRVMTSADLQIPHLNNFFCIIAPDNGEVLDVAEKKEFGAGRYISVHYDSMEPDDGVFYDFKDYDAGNNSVTVRQIHVVEGQRFKKGDVLVSSNFVKDGVLTLGVNALTAYCPDGYNYEDGVHISESLCNKLSAYKLVTEKVSNASPNAKKYMVTHAAFGRWLRPGKENCATISVSYGKGGADRLYRYSLHKGKGFLENYRILQSKSKKNSKLKYDGLEVDTISIQPHTGGDKLTNRHGNKTVMPEPEKNSKMLRLKNGMPVELIYNPHGVPSRMNCGQLNECPLGLAMTLVDSHIVSDPFNGATDEEVAMLMKYVYELANSTGDPRAICSNYPLIPQGIHDRACNRIEEIRLWAGCFDERGGAYLIDPVKGEEITESKVFLGYIYVEKLIQESDSKMHARGGAMAGEEYAAIADAPTHGAARGGGQRFGTMECDALCADGASELIQELVGFRGDNAIQRTNVNLSAYLPSEQSAALEINAPGQRRSVTQFLYTMLALGVMFECDDDEFIPLSRYNSDVGYWTTEYISKYSDGEEVDRNNRKRFDSEEQDSAPKVDAVEDAINELAALGAV